MALSPGDKLGPYEILAPIGAGGMGEVHKARDTRLDRTVAIKVLPEHIAKREDLRARFEREARAVASLKHPHICTLFDIGSQDGAGYMVMEFMEGETLADRIAKGALPLDQAIKFATQIADALDRAHRAGVTHRDVKPQNIMLTRDGAKVLDFGLAKSVPKVGPTDETLTAVLTTEGTVMGTPQYMAPEQFEGKEADARSDIWAFGAVLYEMVTGQKAFQGKSYSSLLGSILSADPPPMSVKPFMPTWLERLVRRCLQKDPDDRYQSMRDVVIELQTPPQEVAAVVPSKASRWPWAIAASLAIVTGVALWAPWRTLPTPDRPLTRLNVDLGPEAQRHARVSVLLSPDGTRIVYAAKAAGGLFQLMTRRLDQPNATVLVATPTLDFEPFFSPDSQWVGFWSTTGSQVMKVPAQGGAAVPIGASAGPVFGASWGDDNNILIGGTDGLWRLPASGGTPQRVPNATGVLQLPQVLPGSKAVLVNSATVGMNDLDGQDIDVFELGTGKRKTLIRGGYWPRYLPTSGTTGHLLYIHTGSLYGVGFDPGSLELVGTPSVLLDDVAADPALNDGGGQFDFSKTGTFVYLSGKTQGTVYPISWLDASGKTAPLVSPSGNYGVPRLSPDGKRVAYLAAGGKGSDVWVYNIDRGTPTQLTFTGGLNSELAWARDSKHLVYGDGTGLWWIRADGAGQRQPLLETADTPRPFCFEPTQNNNEARLAFLLTTTGLPYISTLPIDLTDPEHPKAGKPEPFLAVAAFAQADPMFSPDGKFIAYASGESGNEEVFVRPFPGPGGKWKVSSKGGKFPSWSAATHELLFLGGDDRIMAASYSTQGDAFSAGVPRVWSPTQVRRNGVRQNFDVSPDGKRVIMFPRPVAEESTGNLHATFLLNFFDEVRRRVPLGK